jgi:hypothetical protein
MPTSILMYAADMIEQASLLQNVLVVIGPKLTWVVAPQMSAFGV